MRLPYENATRDALDVKIVHCLQVAPRASFAVIGSVLAVSEQTVARRYRRLLSSGAARVIGFVDAEPFGRQNWMLHLSCRPDSALNIGRAVAGRRDVQWVAVMSGGTQVDCVLRPRSIDEQDQLLLRQLPRTAQITGIEASSVLHVYRGSTTKDWRLGPDFLSAEEEQRLVGGTPAPSGRSVELTASDEPLVQALMVDGRATYADLRSASDGMTEAQVRRRVTELREAGALYFDVDIDERQFGLALSAQLHLTVAPSHLHAVGEAVGAHPAVRFCGATSGPTSITANVAAPDTESIYRFVSEEVGRLEGVAQVQVALVSRILKRAGAVVERDRGGS